MARLLAETIGSDIGKRFIVENRAGSGGTIGTNVVAKSPPDGYTLALVGTSHCMNATLQKLPYDPIDDFTPIALVANTPSVLFVHPRVPANTVQEFIALAKRNAGTINYASAGNGSTPHLHAELFKIMTGVNIVHVPYKGSTPARVAVMSGEAQADFDGLLPSLPLIKEGKLRALGVTNARRTAVAPDIPTIAESGVPGYVADSWYALLGAGQDAENGERQALRHGPARAPIPRDEGAADSPGRRPRHRHARRPDEAAPGGNSEVGAGHPEAKIRPVLISIKERMTHQ